MSDTKRPELGKIEEGQRVMVVQMRRGGSKTFKPARVTSVGRKWVYVLEDDTQYQWQMRIDTQSEFTEYGAGAGARFATPEQVQWENRCDDAWSFLEYFRTDSPRGGNLSAS